MLGAAAVLTLRLVDPFEPPHAIELMEMCAVVAEVKCPAIFQLPVEVAYLKFPAASIGMLKTLVGARPVPHRYVK